MAVGLEGWCGLGSGWVRFLRGCVRTAFDRTRRGTRVQVRVRGWRAPYHRKLWPTPTPVPGKIKDVLGRVATTQKPWIGTVSHYTTHGAGLLDSL